MISVDEQKEISELDLAIQKAQVVLVRLQAVKQWLADKAKRASEHPANEE